MTSPAATGQPERAVELYAQGLSLRQVGEQLGIAHTTVRTLLLRAEVPLALPGRRHLTVVPDHRSRRPAVMQVAPDRATVAYTADRGWHMTQAPPGWFLDMLAELETDAD